MTLKERRMNRVAKFSSAAFGMVMLLGLAYYQGRVDQATGEEDKLVGAAVAAGSDMEAIDGNSPTRALPERDAYFPGTEELAADEQVRRVYLGKHFELKRKI